MNGKTADAKDLIVDLNSPWGGQSLVGKIYIETGTGSHSANISYPSYCIIAPQGLEIVTVGMKSDAKLLGYDHLYIRVLCAKAAIVPLDLSKTTFIIFVKDDGLKTASLFKTVEMERTLNPQQFSALMKEMRELHPEQSTADYLKYLKQNVSRDYRGLVELAPWQKHQFVYRGLKLGAFLSDYFECDPEEMETFEQKAGIALPEDYKAFLIETNGGQLKNHVFFKPPGVKKRRLQRFERFGNPNNKKKFGNPNAYFKYHEHPALFQIASDSSDNPIYICVGSESFGSVLYIGDHSNVSKMMTTDELLNLKAVRQLGSSFSDFLEQLEITDTIIGNE